ncbi:MAG: hypothetical protein KUG69_09940 [Marinosulfonomonas sp.]|nr:hypothetical protein [Marinosulfonomonas sp.]
MTALKEFERLESSGIWHAAPDAQRRDVIVSVGDATLTISDHNETAITHWSLPAIQRVNPGKRPAVFRPGEDAAETLELDDDTLIRAIARVHSAIEKRRPHHGRLRLAIVGGLSLVAVFLALFWLPGAMIKYTASVVPETKRVAIGENLLTRIQRISGRPCNDPLGQTALNNLHSRLSMEPRGKIVVLSSGVRTAAHLPGGIILLNRALVEDFEDPEVPAGFVLVELLRGARQDPLLDLLHAAGLSASFRLLTTGELRQTTLDNYAENLLISDRPEMPNAAILDRFSQAGIRTSPYAYAIDISGETTIGLIEADPVTPQSTRQVLDDSSWVSLQAICGG